MLTFFYEPFMPVCVNTAHGRMLQLFQTLKNNQLLCWKFCLCCHKHVLPKYKFGHTHYETKQVLPKHERH